VPRPARNPARIGTVAARRGKLLNRSVVRLERLPLAALGAALRNENIRRVEVAWGAAIAAEWAHFVALGIFAYEHGGAASVGLAGLVRLLPAGILAPFAASFGDRFRRERFLLCLALVGAAALAGSTVAASANNKPLVFVLAAVVGIASTLFRPALQALLPLLARTPQELIASNGATSTVESIGALVGPLLTGVLVTVADVALVFGVGAGAFLAAAVLLAGVKVEGRFELEDVSVGGTRELLTAGWRAITGAPRTRLVVVLTCAQTFVRGCLNVLIVVAAYRILDSGAAAVGYMTAAIGIGGLIGAVGAIRLEASKLAAWFGIALVFWGAPIVLMAPRPYLGVVLVLLAIVGAANSVEDVAVFTLLQRIVPDEILTRVLGAVWGLAMGCVALGSIAAPALVELVGPRAAFVVIGSILPLLTLLVYRRLVEIDSVLEPPRELELIDGVPMFAPLSVAAKERIAGRLVPLTVSQDDVVLRAGEAGDRFYIVADGALDIDADGRHVTAHRADYFGEIALLREVPRTATVTALVDSNLYALQRNDFLAAVTGHSAARAAGETVTAARLAGHGP
jgi:MFS family permease